MSVITQFITDKKSKHEFDQKVTAVEVPTEVKEECREFGALSYIPRKSICAIAILAQGTFGLRALR
jgi:hypothetical protein